MPKTTIDYSKAVIYKIQHQDKPELLYVGSTTNLPQRKSNHKWLSKNDTTKLLYQRIRETGGIENWDFEIYEKLWFFFSNKHFKIKIFLAIG